MTPISVWFVVRILRTQRGERADHFVLSKDISEQRNIQRIDSQPSHDGSLCSWHYNKPDQSATAVEYSYCFSAEGYDAKQSDSEFSGMLELWGMQNTALLPLLPDPLWPGMVAPDRVLSMGQIELNYVLMLNWIAWNRTVLTLKLRPYAKRNSLK